MTRTAGIALLHTSRTAHACLAACIGLLMIGSVLVTAAAWRLSRGPIDSSWLANRLNAALLETAAPVRLSFGDLTVAWDGFRRGGDGAIDVHVSGLAVTDLEGRDLLTADLAQLRFSVADVVRGRTFPRSIEIERPRLAVTPESVALIETPPQGPDDRRAGIPALLQRVRIRDASVDVSGLAPVPDLRTHGVDLDLLRRGNGHIGGSLSAPLSVGGATTLLTAVLDLAPGGESSLIASAAPFRPSGIAQPSLAFLAGVDLPVSLSATVALGPDLAPRRATVSAALGQGRILAGTGSVPVLGGYASASGTPDRIALSRLHLDLNRAPDGVLETADVAGTATLSAGRIGAALTAVLQHIDAADVGLLWPAGVGGGSRGWIVEHVTAGMVSHGSVAFTIEAGSDLRDIALTKAAGDMDISNAAFTWIDNVPPVEQSEVHLRLVDPDTLDITIPAARQRVRPHMPDLAVSAGRMRITGLSARDQFADIRTGVDGPVTSALALLNEPRLHLLSAHPLGLRPSAGDASAALSFRFPLEDKLQIDDVDIRASVRLAQVRIPAAVRDLPLEDGAFDMTVDKDGLGFKGRGSVASVPLALAGTMDFRAGPADQVVQRVTASGLAGAAQLIAAGLPLKGLLGGAVPLGAEYQQRRNGEASLALTGDLSAATIDLAPLAWHKAAGTGAHIAGTLVLSRGRLARIDGMALRGDGIALAGSAAFPEGQGASVTLDRVVLGRTSAQGTVRIPPGGVIGVVLQGAAIDLGPKLTEAGGSNDLSVPVTTPSWILDARFDKALLANGETAGDLRVSAAGDGERIGTVSAGGMLEGGKRFDVDIERTGDGRRLTVRAGDAGRFLRGVDAIRGMASGKLAIDGTFEGPAGLSPLTGTATLDDVTVRKSPLLGKLLQAITVYGLVDALSGPGMAFARIVAPFRYDGRDLYLTNAVARNSSLGLTASGRIGLSSDPSSLAGTIVPAYFFNALPGRLPFIGRLFSPEKGGGLFAVRFGLDGPIADPDVSVNPVSGLAPGFLREIFGLFGSRPKAPP